MFALSFNICEILAKIIKRQRFWPWKWSSRSSRRTGLSPFDWNCFDWNCSNPSIYLSIRSSVHPSMRPFIHPSIRPSIYPSICMSTCLCRSIFLSVCLIVRLSVRPPVRPSVHPSVRPFVRSSVSQSVRPSVRWSARPSVRPSVRQSVRKSASPSVRPSVHPSVRPSVGPPLRPYVPPPVRPSVSRYVDYSNDISSGNGRSSSGSSRRSTDCGSSHIISGSNRNSKTTATDRLTAASITTSSRPSLRVSFRLRSSGAATNPIQEVDCAELLSPSQLRMRPTFIKMRCSLAHHTVTVLGEGMGTIEWLSFAVVYWP